MHAKMQEQGVSLVSNSCCKTMNPRFMQPLIPGFLSNFSIPVSFLKHLVLDLDGHPLESVVLMTEDQPQPHWVVKIEGGRHFRDGWKNFALHHHLQVGDFLVFTHEGHRLFQVHVFDPFTACERSFISSKCLVPKAKPRGSKRTKLKFKSTCTRNQREPNAQAQAATEFSSGQAENLSCRVTLTSYYVQHSIVYLPRDFVRLSGLAMRSCNIKIIDGKQNIWQVKLSYKKSDGQSYINRGWKDFQTANSVKPKSVISFQLLEAGRKPVLKCLVSTESIR